MAPPRRTPRKRSIQQTLLCNGNQRLLLENTVAESSGSSEGSEITKVYNASQEGVTNVNQSNSPSQQPISTNDSDDDQLLNQQSRADELRAESDARKRRRRGTSSKPRERTSIWSTIGCTGVDGNKETKCTLCGSSISVSNNSSSNVLKHYDIWHKELYR